MLIKDTVNLAEEYERTKSIIRRNEILKVLLFENNDILKDFFLRAFKRERYLDMKLITIRGYSRYASEQEVIPLMNKFFDILIKRAETPPYNYEEYEMLRSEFGLPYLIETYGYDCFKRAYEQVEIQYANMPDAYKGIFTLNAKGEVIELLPPGVALQRMNKFFGR